MEPDQTEKKKKDVYQKPRLRTIELAAEEVLGVGCKLTSGGFASGAYPCFPGNNCSQAGS